MHLCNFVFLTEISVNWTGGQQEVKVHGKCAHLGGLGRKWATVDITPQTAQISLMRAPTGGSCRVPVTSGVLGSGFSLPYLWGHSANGGQVITSAQEVRSVDLQLKVAQPLDNGLWALQEKKKVAMVSLSSCRFCKSRFCLSSTDLSYRHSFNNAAAMHHQLFLLLKLVSRCPFYSSHYSLIAC